MHKFGCHKIIFSSTCATYGIPEEIPILEDTPQQPINPYGASKLMFENILRWYDQIHDIKSIILRYFNVAGADFGIGEDHDPETHLIPLTIHTALGKEKKMRIFGTDYDTPDGTCIRDYIHVTDLTIAHDKASVHLEKTGESDFFNLGTETGTSVYQIIDIIQDLSKKQLDVVTLPRRKGDPAVLIANSQKACNVLGWSAERSIDEIVTSAWNWYRSGTR
jgi:UDP-glucose 4-epimerase